MPLITSDDFIETWSKINQRGFSFFLSKFNPKPRARTLSAFDSEDIQSSNWWSIPEVKRRWNEKISGDPSLGYEAYTVHKYLKDRKSLKMLSIGSGVCSHEILFAKAIDFDKIVCVDLAVKPLEEARKKVSELGFTNFEFVNQDVYKLDYEPEIFDVILFHMSLHHFTNINNLLQKMKTLLKKDGILIINEYVGPNRLQVPKSQIQQIQKALESIPEKWRSRFQSNRLKTTVSGPGYLRMIMADPSECVESEKIVPALHNNFIVKEEKPLGGNILTFLFKDIAHHFLNPNTEQLELLSSLFTLEDEYLANHLTDYLFGIYAKE